MNSPFVWPAAELKTADLTDWRYFFARCLRKRLPCQEVLFIEGSEAAEPGRDWAPEWQEALRLVAKKGQPVVAGDSPRLFLPLKVGEALYGVAVLSGGESELYENYTIKTILERSQGLADDFRQLKARGVEPVSGLFSAQLFREVMTERLVAGEAFHLALLEIHPRIRDAAQSLAYLKRAAGALDAMSGREVPVYHLGSGIFAMLWEDEGDKAAREAGDLVLYRLQREGLSRAHLGLARAPQTGRNSVVTLLGHAWEAVVQARRRGPFARATWLSAVESGEHSALALPAKVVNRLRDLSRGCERFAVAALHCDRPEEAAAFAADLGRLIEPGWELVSRLPQELFLFLPGLDSKDAHTAVRALQGRFGTAGKEGFSAGISAYPERTAKKSAVALDARKALLHATFYGTGSCVFFDAIALNISGDLYYNDGALTEAIREYQLGLELAPENVNLLNSLGVAYVKFNRLSKAAACFERVLGLEPDNFMALFNLGSTWLTLGREDLAGAYLERGLRVNDAFFDLVLQLAGLYCRSGQYGRVVELLDPAVADPEERLAEWEMAAACRYLGEALRRLGENRRAMTILQRANRYNPRDSRVLSLLGEVYDAEGQGAEIALSLCRQAVELDEAKWDNWYRLGLVEFRQGLLREAMLDLQRSVRLNRAALEPGALLAEVYEKTGKQRLALRQAGKVAKLQEATCGNS
ncbi:MAG: tetratricopeptide repeat protein [Desulfobulbaceae bacterium]|nr:tetratricopeptide repeat protein [Desulfobulbaceae bacterium]